MAMSMSQPPLSARENRSLRSAGAAFVQVAPGGAPLRGTAKNPLLVRDSVGSAKPSTYDLPHEQFAYGRPCNQDVEGAREVSMRWVSHTPSADVENAAPDYVNFNKKACAAKITNATDLKHFRMERDVVAAAMPMSARGASAGPGYSRNLPKIADMLPEGFTHGRKVRPSTPIGQVISSRFAERSEQELYRFYTEYREATDMMQTQVRKIPLTTASRGHASTARKFRSQQTEESQRELFKLKKWNRVPGKVSTRRKAISDGGYLSPEVSEVGLDDDNGSRQGSERQGITSAMNADFGGVEAAGAEDPWAL